MNSPIDTGDHFKDEVQRQWDRDACGSQYAKEVTPDTLEFYLAVERYRYGTYGPWMPALMEFSLHSGKKVLEVGGGMGTDLAQFAKGGSLVTDFDLSSGHLAHAKRNFALRGLTGEFVHGDAENMPFDDYTFDLVYSNGVIHHTPNTYQVVAEMHRVLKPGGTAIVMVYAENSLHYWRNLVKQIGVDQGQLQSRSIGDIMSEVVELSEHGSKPLVKVYTRERLRSMFCAFQSTKIYQRQMVDEERHGIPKIIPTSLLGRLMGWNLVIKARKDHK